MIKDIENEEYFEEDLELERNSKVLNYKNVIVFIVSFLLSQVQFVSGFAPFGMAILGAAMVNKIPLAIPFVGVSAGILLSAGLNSWLIFLATAFLFIVLTILFKKKDAENELMDRPSNFKLFFCVFAVQIVNVLMGQVLVYDIILAIVTTLATLVFYTLFTYGLYVLCNIKENMIFSIEEVIGASILACLCICAFGPIEILGFNVRNVLCILVVLILGWKNGISIGATAGVTIGCILALVGAGDIALIASYAISGLLAGVFRKFGKIGVVVGFILGNAMLAMYANGSTEAIILIKEILLASVVLLVIPKKIEQNMDDLFEKTLLLKEGNDAEYSVDKKVVYKLNTVSEVFDEMAENLGQSAATVVDDKEEIVQFFEDVIAKTCDNCNSEKCWKKDLYKKYNIMFKIIDVLVEKNEITQEEFQKIVKNKCVKQEEFVRSLNGTYDLYKLNENWKKKLQENKIVLSKQMKEFSNVISSIVNDINSSDENNKQKNKFKITIGISKTAKENNDVNGDNNIIMKLENGKYVIGLSDGMGSGETADKNSKLVIQMLEKFLKSGFDKQTAINLINSLLILKSEKENFATMDISVVDTNSGKVEFVKVGACPTFIKKKDRVEFVDSISLPVGIVENIESDLYDRELEDGDYIVMVTDGIIDSNDELHEKWIQELLEKTDIDNPQRLADVIIQESVDNTYGIAKDDMTVVVSKVKINE